ncbi:uncharacterized protein LAESUDRAFT_109954 [Laetiporus sulphureus 93-53]|uniref:Secreted protein n=1 Tax=Laetiporus sulphureus 93-53 TaxID=1314785 RepID=A0A165EN91_9APHY|nr:uncharacterized protein LAESUDRAFT_109954 [Laetiporus sulphureus 93-53]KZT07418.1 hypothetical protein LAESUDRAFT_109954 [Laetiporus sulphureus 93-53]
MVVRAWGIALSAMFSCLTSLFLLAPSSLTPSRARTRQTRCPRGHSQIWFPDSKSDISTASRRNRGRRSVAASSRSRPGHKDPWSSMRFVADTPMLTCRREVPLQSDISCFPLQCFRWHVLISHRGDPLREHHQ